MYVVLRSRLETSIFSDPDGEDETPADPVFEYFIVDIVNGIGDMDRTYTAPDDESAARLRDLLNMAGDDEQWRETIAKLRREHPP